MRLRDVHADGVAARNERQLRERLIGCFNEMPGLIGTADEIARLVGASPQACNRLLERLVEERTVRRRPDGRYTHWVEH